MRESPLKCYLSRKLLVFVYQALERVDTRPMHTPFDTGTELVVRDHAILSD